ncbi:MAG: hypothetical protein AAF968_22525 [Pseudomonadota bacterium]
MKEPWVRWLAFAVLAVTVLVSSCQALAAPNDAAQPSIAQERQDR